MTRVTGPKALMRTACCLACGVLLSADLTTATGQKPAAEKEPPPMPGTTAGRSKWHLWGAVGAGGAGTDEERVAQAFERLGAVVRRDDTKPNRPVIALLFGLRCSTPDTATELEKDYAISCLDLGEFASVMDEQAKGGVKPRDQTSLTAIRVTDADLKDLSKLEHLRVLDLSFSAITNDALQHVKALKDLQTLDLRLTRVNGAGLQKLKDLKNLKVLYLTGFQGPGDGLVHLRGLKNLEVLFVGDVCNDVTDKDVWHLRDLMNLQKLHLHDAVRVTDEGLKGLRGLTNLRELTLNHTKLTDKGLEHLSGLGRLEILELGSTREITDKGLKHLSGLKRLEVLDLHRTRVTDEGLKSLGRNRPPAQAAMKYCVPSTSCRCGYSRLVSRVMR